ncbi:MAG: M23 family metallopeptidase [Candidatus Jorgensenbacteria bacterium]
MKRRRRRTGTLIFGLILASLAIGVGARMLVGPNELTLTPPAPVPPVPAAPPTAPPAEPLEARFLQPPPQEPSPPPAPEPQATAPQVNYSSLTPEQSDTLTITVSGVAATGTVRGEFTSQAIPFLRIADGRWLGFVGIDAKATAGAYPLSLALPDGTTTRETVRVKARDYPVTELAVTDELRAKGYTPPVIAINVAAENARLAAALTGSPPRAYFDGAFTNPLDRIVNVGEYGNIRVSGGVGLRHLGVDLEAETGTPVHTINTGVVRFAEELTNYGKTMVVDHGFGIFSLYLHLSEFLAAPGAGVARGAVIARSGDTGYVLAPHLHFSMRLGSASVDPLRFLAAATWAFEK